MERRRKTLIAGRAIAEQRKLLSGDLFIAVSPFYGPQV
jgi:hypothetical protein